MTIENLKIEVSASKLIDLADELILLSGHKNRQSQIVKADSSADDIFALQTRQDIKQPEHMVERARAAYQNRRIRSKLFKTEALFGEPAWDILLDLFIAKEEGRRVSVTSACIGAAVPSTTGLRWISVLISEGLLERQCDPDDGRRTHIALTSIGYAVMVDYFSYTGT